jgi:5-carboxymethyl-2-hydroxymuconate isomerase
MPHIILETTSDLPENADVPDILEALTQKLATFDTVASEKIKARHYLCSVWMMGEGAPAGFAHCSVAILAGRPLELRKRIAEGMVATMRERFRQSLDAREVAVTLEVREMERETYQM